MIHRVKSGDYIHADDINQFVDVYQQHPTDFIFGTNKGVLIQDGNEIGISKNDNLYFKQIFEVPTTQCSYVAIALGNSFDQAKSELDVDQIYTVVSGDVKALSTWSWYGFSQDPGEEIDVNKMKSSGYALTDISCFGISSMSMYGYTVSAKKGDEGEQEDFYVFSLLDQSDTLNELSNAGLKNIQFNEANKIALKTMYSIQNIGSGGTAIVKTTPRAFDIENLSVVNNKIYCGNQWTYCPDYAINDELSDIYFHVERTVDGLSTYVDQTFLSSTQDRMSIKLYEYLSGEVKLDVRPGFIPILAI